MSKDRSFASKLAKAAHLSAKHCPECGELFRTLKVVKTVKDEKRHSWRFKENFVSVCKCNEAEYLS